MLEYVLVTNHLGDSLKIELARPEDSGLVIRKIDGLGQGSADLSVSEKPSADGGYFYHARHPSRNIVFYFDLLWNPTIEAMRHNLYRLFPIMKTINMKFKTEKRYIEINGYVESNEPEIFTNSSNTMISVICPDPYFYMVKDTQNIESFLEITGGFEFPFKNESLTESLLKFGTIVITDQVNLKYDGEIDAGFKIKAIAKSKITNGFTIHDVLNSQSLEVNFAQYESETKEMDVGDELHISTIHGDRYCYLKKYGSEDEINYLDTITNDSEWFKLKYGDNLYSYTVESPNIKDDLELSFIYEDIYWGI